MSAKLHRHSGAGSTLRRDLHSLWQVQRGAHVPELEPQTLVLRPGQRNVEAQLDGLREVGEPGVKLPQVLGQALGLHGVRDLVQEPVDDRHGHSGDVVLVGEAQLEDQHHPNLWQPHLQIAVHARGKRDGDGQGHRLAVHGVVEEAEEELVLEEPEEPAEPVAVEELIQEVLADVLRAGHHLIAWPLEDDARWLDLRHLPGSLPG
mmetsp:Transcript_29378/g.80642  ORF Transcript_29378/g.80642 Transcript_29378/m.80642 type:complete len:205 (-) Transcript_29378:287-901(-)